MRLSAACDVSLPLRVGFDEHPLMLDGRVSLFGEGSSIEDAVVRGGLQERPKTSGNDANRGLSFGMSQSWLGRRE